MNDYRRMNVAVTRARHFLMVVGNSRTLKRNNNWKAFIDYSKTLKGGFIGFQSKESYEDHKLLDILKNSLSEKANEKKTSK